MRFSFAKFLLPSALLAGTAAQAQQVKSLRENIPYSRYGIGETLSGTSVAQKGAAGASLGVSAPFSINTENPASYAALRLTTFEGAVSGGTRSIVSGSNTYQTGTATLSYLRVGFPLANNRAGLVFGLEPMSRVYYNLSDTGTSTGLGNTSNTFNGLGGLNQAFAGAAGEYKDFRIGVNVGYVFGNFDEAISRQYYQTDSASTFGSEFANNVKVGGLHYKVGAQYLIPIKKLIALRLGGTATLQQSLGAERNTTWNSVRFINGGGTVIDTAFAALGEKGRMQLPLSYGGGFQLLNGTQWAINADITGTRWTDYRLFDQKDSVGGTTYKFALGGEYTPQAANSFKYLQRITYRAGFVYGADPYVIRGEHPTTVMGTLGVSLPFKRTTDRLHLALEFGRRTSKTEGAIRENFVRFSLGLSLNDKWFVKRRYD
jgi:hypothetical protein